MDIETYIRKITVPEVYPAPFAVFLNKDDKNIRRTGYQHY